MIKGSAINNDGALRIGYTAPGVDGQASVITEAMDVAGVDPESIQCIETHGSGTSLGDLVEMTALNKAFRLHTRKSGFCAIGSVKTNIGHVSTAAGVAGLIKMVLSLKHRLIPPSLNFEEPNPKIDFANSPFFVNTKLREWKRQEEPRRGGVSAFGLGGANAHVVLEEAPATESGSESRRYQMVMLSGFTETALESMTDNLVKHLREHPELKLADVSYTLQVGRASFGHRRVLVCSEMEEAVKALAERDPERVYTMHQWSQDQLQQEPGVVFLFPGVGDHYAGMGRELYESEAVFRQWVNRCAELLQPQLGRDMRTVLFPAEAARAAGAAGAGEQGGRAGKGEKGKVDMRQMLGRQPRQQQPAQSWGGGEEEALQRTELAQPAVFVIEYALAQLLMSWGIQPKAMIGYSLGEYVAACVAGVMKLEDALRLVAKRAQMIQRVEEGAMLTVALSEGEARGWVSGEVGVSAVLTPKVSVLGGTVKGIEEVEKQLTKRGIACRRLGTRHAFHSPMMQKLEKEWSEEMAGVGLKAPSNVAFSGDTLSLSSIWCSPVAIVFIFIASVKFCSPRPFAMCARL